MWKINEALCFLGMYIEWQVPGVDVSNIVMDFPTYNAINAKDPYRPEWWDLMPTDEVLTPPDSGGAFYTPTQFEPCTTWLSKEGGLYKIHIKPDQTVNAAAITCRLQWFMHY